MSRTARVFLPATMSLLGAIAFSCSTDPKVTQTGGGEGGTAGGGGGGSGTRDGGFVLNLPEAGVGAADAAGGNPGGAVMYAGGVTRPCVDLECQQTTCRMGQCKQQACSGAARTTLSGRVYDPAGKVPLYNVVVYVPNAALDPISTGPGCNRCDSALSGKPIASALTDTKGDFVLDNIPVGTDIPLVIQIGKWRRQVTLPRIAACADNKMNDPNLLRLPRNQREGHIPRIALTTGEADRLECLLRKIGLEDAEFTPETGTGRVNLFKGVDGSGSYQPPLNDGANFTEARTFWNNPQSFMAYDIVMLSCEGGQHPNHKSQAARTALAAYADAGGRVFASHWHNVWIEHGPMAWQQTATFGRHPDLSNARTEFVADIDQSFPKGEALASWLVNVQASPTPGKLGIFEAQHTVTAVMPSLSRRWIHSTTTDPASVQYFTFNTPVGAEAGKECGRVVFTDIHVSSGDRSGVPFPSGCRTMDLTPQEKALEFMLFDLSSCVQRDDIPPMPPKVIP